MFNINRLGIKAIRHVVTPRISASYSPDFSRQRLGGFESVVNADRLEEPDSVEADLRPYSIFYKPVYGAPGRGESGRMSFSLNNNFEMKVNQKTDTGMAVKKVKLVDALNFSGSYNFLADSQKLSNINANFRTRILDKYDIQVNATVDPYALAPNGRRIDQFLWDDKRRLGRLTSMQVAFQTDFRSMKGEKQEGTSFYDPYYTSFEAPWNFGLRYNLNYTKPRFTAETRQQVNFNASLNLTDNWRLQGNSGYDLTNQKFSTTSINIGRDLHCWQFDVRWIPFGSRRSYYFSLNVKASVLQDLKIDKRQDFFDFTER
jgi:lipopolysaccharide assembly outer membrane protein LptD (OstA)